MAEYQRIEYRIDSEGNIQETVLDASGTSCTNTTTAIEQALGEVTSQEKLPSYYEEDETLTIEMMRSLKQQ